MWENAQEQKDHGVRKAPKVLPPGTYSIVPQTSFSAVPGAGETQIALFGQFGQISVTSGFGQPPGPSFAQPPVPSFAQPPVPSFAQPPVPSFAQPPVPSFAQPPGPSSLTPPPGSSTLAAPQPSVSSNQTPKTQTGNVEKGFEQHSKATLSSKNKGDFLAAQKRNQSVREQQLYGMFVGAFGRHVDEDEVRSVIRNILSKTKETNFDELASQVALDLAMMESRRDAEERNRAVNLQGGANEVVDLEASREGSVDREICDLRTAMAESLRESELNEMAIVPLKDRTENELLEHFSQSQIIAKCGEEEWFRRLFDETTKERLTELLQKEKECAKWYPCIGTSKYFEKLATQFFELGATGSVNLMQFMDSQTRTLVEGYSSFPSEPGTVPRIFADLQENSGVETIDLLD